MCHSAICVQNPTLSCRILAFPCPAHTIFLDLCLLKSPKSLPGGSSEDPLGADLFPDGTELSSSLLESAVSPCSMIQPLAISWRNFLHLSCFVWFSVLYIKNVLNKPQFRRNNNRFLDHFTVSGKWVTDLHVVHLLCTGYILLQTWYTYGHHLPC